MLSSVFKPFVEKSPVPVMARGLMERVLNPEQLNQWFDATAAEQYTKDLLFSSLFDIMSQVVQGSRRSVHAAYQASQDDISVSITSLYNKLNGIEPRTSAELVRYAAGKVAPIIDKLGGTLPDPIPGLRVKLLDGNCIEKSHHRINELRFLSAGPLPGKSLVVYDPVMRLPIDVFPCEDGHSQERSLLNQVLLTIDTNDVWIADRNFCTLDFTCSIASRQAYFVIREHKKYPFELLGKEKYIGRCDTGKVYEQGISVVDGSGHNHTFRRIRIHLGTNTRDGDSDIFIIANLSKSKANAKLIAGLYRGRWTIGVSSKGHIIQSVQVRPGLIDSGPVAWEAPWRESKMVKPSDTIFRKETMQGFRPQRTVNADVASSHAIPVAETVDHARRQQAPFETSLKRRRSPAGYQRWHVAKDYVATGEALGARRRNLVEEAIPITVSGKWDRRRQGGGLGCSTIDRCAAKHTRRKGPRPVNTPFGCREAGAR